MTSKEAIKIISKRFNTEYDWKVCYGDDVVDMLDLIEKDLEKLENIKELYKETKRKKCDRDFILDAIGEWLEDDM